MPYHADDEINWLPFGRRSPTLFDASHMKLVDPSDFPMQYFLPVRRVSECNTGTKQLNASSGVKLHKAFSTPTKRVLMPRSDSFIMMITSALTVFEVRHLLSDGPRVLPTEERITLCVSTGSLDKQDKKMITRWRQMPPCAGAKTDS